MNKMRLGAALLAGSCLLLVGSFALPHTAPEQSQPEMDQQAADAFAKADKALNIVYLKVCKDSEPITLQKLKVSERSWLAFREAEANYEASEEAEGGTMYPEAYDLARARLTLDRIKQLKHDAEQ
jgi:uncharacterized protein YecT (DUF1311 family)